MGIGSAALLPGRAHADEVLAVLVGDVLGGPAHRESVALVVDDVPGMITALALLGIASVRPWSPSTAAVPSVNRRTHGDRDDDAGLGVIVGQLGSAVTGEVAERRHPDGSRFRRDDRRRHRP